MTNIEFFKNQAKLLLKDWKIREQRHFPYNVKELFFMYDVPPKEKPTLMKAQHLLALSLGRNSWSDLINDSKENLEYTKMVFLEDRLEMLEEFKREKEQEMKNPPIEEGEEYHGMVECMHCGQRFPIDNPNHLPSCDGEVWDLVPVDEL